MKKQFHLTKEGIQELETELAGLISQRGPIAQRIKDAREFGDLAENAEYTAARQEQEKVEGRISEIENILQNVTVIAKPKTDGKVRLGSLVKLKNGHTKEFQVVGTVEADPSNGKISDESPIGQALMGKRVGEAVEINTATGPQIYKVVQIS